MIFAGEVESILPTIERFIRGSRQHCGESGVGQYSTNIAVGKDEGGRTQYFMYIKEPLEKGQVVGLSFCTPSRMKTEGGDCLPVGNMRLFLKGSMSRLSSEGLQSLLVRVSQFVTDSIDSKLGGFGTSEEGGNADQSLFDNLVIGKRRAHWVASMIMCSLKKLEMKHKSFKVKRIDSNIFWTSQLVAKLKMHPAWNDSNEDAIKSQVREELASAFESHEYLNSANRERWCRLAMELFREASLRVERFSTSPEEYSQDQLIIDISALVTEISKWLMEVQGSDEQQDLEKLVVTFEHDSDNLQSASPSFRHAFHTSIAQSYEDALTICNMSPFRLPVPNVLKVVATSTEKDEKANEKSSVDAVFRTLEDARRCSQNIHGVWYVRHQVLRVLSSLLSCSTAVLENDSSLKDVVMPKVEATLNESGIATVVGESKKSSLG